MQPTNENIRQLMEMLDNPMHIPSRKYETS